MYMYMCVCVCVYIYILIYMSCYSSVKRRLAGFLPALQIFQIRTIDLLECLYIFYTKKQKVTH